MLSSIGSTSSSYDISKLNSSNPNGKCNKSLTKYSNSVNFIVSDFNEPPLNPQGFAVGYQRKTKQKSARSLENELDMTLKKLDELQRLLHL